MPNTKKITQVHLITDSLNKNKNFILLKYSGVTTQTFESLRKKLKEVNSSLTIIKNTLFEKTVNILTPKNDLYKNLRQKFFPLKEPTAIVYLGEEWSPALKIYYEFTRNLDKFSFKFGLLDKEIYDEPELKKISQLPSKKDLMAKLISGLNNPTRQVIYAMKSNINKLAFILKQKSQEGR